MLFLIEVWRAFMKMLGVSISRNFQPSPRVQQTGLEAKSRIYSIIVQITRSIGVDSSLGLTMPRIPSFSHCWVSHTGLPQLPTTLVSMEPSSSAVFGTVGGIGGGIMLITICNAIITVFCFFIQRSFTPKKQLFDHVILVPVFY